MYFLRQDEDLDFEGNKSNCESIFILVAEKFKVNLSI